MGNCALKDCYNNANSTTLRDISVISAADAAQRSMIKVVTTTGGIMELYAPITAEQITSEFPNHGLFLNPNPNATQPPVLHNDTLCPGQLYYLLPLYHSSTSTTTNTSNNSSSNSNSNSNNNDNNYNNNSNNNNSLLSTPYRMSVDVGPKVVYRRHPDPDVVPRYSGSGVWKVRLVINPEQLSEILSQDNKTQQLIESVRTVAKCGNGKNNNASGAKTTSSSLSSSVGTSSSNNTDDQCSVSSCNFRW